MKLFGTVSNIIFRNSENGYTVFIVENNKKKYTLVGDIITIDVGVEINANVKEVFNELYGTQYKVLSYDLELPKDEKYIIKYLSSNDFYGIGEVIATRIVSYFGENAISKILDNKDELYNIKGMTKKRVDDLYNILNIKKYETEIILYLEKFDLPLNTAKRILSKYGEKTIEIVNKNPYILSNDIEGIAFLTCDKIAFEMGIEKTDIKRVMAGIEYVLICAYKNGNSYLPKNVLEEMVNEIIGFSIDEIDEKLIELQKDGKIKVVVAKDEYRVYLKANYILETNLSKLLYEFKDNIKIITGGPGTGKTYNINKYINESIKNGYNLMVCAPTGRASKRIYEVTNFEAKTIHRLLEFTKETDDELGITKYLFRKNENNKLDTDVLIIDEMSMVDESLMYAILLACNKNTKILLVGDVNQLPSVGMGNVLFDMINSNLFDVEFLNKVYRQDETSKIVENAHYVNEGKKFLIDNKTNDFKFATMNSDITICDAIIKLVSVNLPKHFDIKLDEIQVICPSKKGNCGTESLNIELQNALNPKTKNSKEIKINDTIFRINDKVMQTKNNYDLEYNLYDENSNVIYNGFGVFNGDIGRIIDIDDFNKSIKVKFDDKEVLYDYLKAKDLSLAYAITVHKSQGSEYDIVIMPMSRCPRPLLNRKILYTAITRAKKTIILVGNKSIFYSMIDNAYETKRYTKLCDKLYIS